MEDKDNSLRRKKTKREKVKRKEIKFDMQKPKLIRNSKLNFALWMSFKLVI